MGHQEGAPGGAALLAGHIDDAGFVHRGTGRPLVVERAALEAIAGEAQRGEEQGGAEGEGPGTLGDIGHQRDHEGHGHSCATRPDEPIYMGIEHMGGNNACDIA